MNQIPKLKNIINLKKEKEIRASKMIRGEMKF